jgi:hypothetical protein
MACDKCLGAISAAQTAGGATFRGEAERGERGIGFAKSACAGKGEACE